MSRTRSALARALLVGASFALSLLASLLVLRRLTPEPFELAPDSRWFSLSRLAQQHAIQLGLALFVGFVAISRYWLAVFWPAAEPPPRPSPSSLREGAVALGLAALAGAAALVLRASVIETHSVGSTSMLPGLRTGDRIAVDKRAYGFSLPGSNRHPSKLPARGDVVVFRSPAAEGGNLLVKRVIGLPGDRIEMWRGHPIVNGARVPSCDVGPYLHVTPERVVQGWLVLEFLDDARYLTVHTTGQKEIEEYRVKPGEVFVLGDDRNNSSDSRSFNRGRGGGVPIAALEGRGNRFLHSRSRDGRLDFSSALEPLDRLRIRIDGAQSSALEAGLKRCIERGKVSEPSR